MIPADPSAATGAVLVVDDNREARRMVERFLLRLQHRVDSSASVEEALGKLDGAAYDVVITDLRMPGASGIDLLREIRTRWPATRCILMSGQAEAADAAAAIEQGVDRMLLKPFELEELRAGVEKALAEKRARDEIIQNRTTFEAMLRQRQTESRIWVLRAAHALAAAVEAKDAYTAGHTTRVTTYALAIADIVGGVEVISFRLAGSLHDVGKIGVPDAVLNKPGRLTEEEFEQIRRHPATGEQILRPFVDDSLVLEVVRSHHERWDGRGYPDGLGGQEIPLPARILAVADTLDAMTSNRAYRKGMTWQVAVDEIGRRAGSQFDPDVVDAFRQALPGLHAHYASFPDPAGILLFADPARE